tara:strand:- start:18319 stop:23031 length:4713 start_codon:yes stop_codon:yes gene_type:complete
MNKESTMKSRNLKGAIAVTTLSLMSPFSLLAADLKGQVNFDQVQYSNATLIFIKDGTEVATTTTDEYGKYEVTDIEPGRYRVRVRSSEFNTAQSFANVEVGQNVHNVWLLSDVQVTDVDYFEVSGTLSDLNGRTYSDAEIQFTSWDGFGSVTIYTDSEGYYSTMLPEGNYSTYYRYYDDIDIDNDGVDDQYLNMRVENDVFVLSQASTLDLVFPLKEVRLSAVYDNETVNANATISDYWSDNNADGTSRTNDFYLYSYDNNLTNVLVPTGRSVSGALRPSEDTHLFITPFEELAVSNDTVVNEFEVELIDVGYEIEVSIVDYDGSPLMGACANLSGHSYLVSDNQCASETTNIVNLRVPAQDYTFSSSNYYREWISKQDEYRYYYFSNLEDLLLANEVTEIVQLSHELTLPVYLQRGRVIDSEGNRVEGAQVEINASYNIDRDGGSTYVYVSHDGEVTNQNGIFESYVPLELSEVYVRAPLNSSLSSKTQEYSFSRKDKVFTITLDGVDDEEPEPGEGFQITGNVKNIQGDALTLVVRVYDENYDLVDEVSTDENGRYSAQVPTAGSYRVDANYDNYWSPASYSSSNYLIARTELFNVEANTTKDIVVPVISTSLRAVDIGGNPIVGLQFEVRGNMYPASFDIDYAYSRHGGVTSQNGTFEITAPLENTQLFLSGGTLPIYFNSSIAGNISTRVHTDVIYLSSFELLDRDENGIPDFYQDRFGYDDPSVDYDNDGLTFLQEYQNMSSPFNGDTDRDGIPDSEDNNSQMFNGLGSLDYSRDSDSDGWSDIAEILFGLNHNDPESFPIKLDQLILDNDPLEMCVMDSLSDWGNEDAEYAHDIRELYCYNYAFEDLDGIAQFVNLESFEIGYSSSVEDFSELANLIRLRNLYLYDQTLTSLDFVSDLVSLQVLTVSLRDFDSSLEPLLDLDLLISLRLDLWNFTGDLSVISQLTQLKTLELSPANTLSNLDFLLPLTGLERLVLNNGELLASELPKLANLTNLTSLTLNYTPIDNLEWISALVNLEQFGTSGQTGVDFSPLQQLSKLYWVSIYYSDLTHVEFLEGLSLRYLYLWGNDISDISGLEGMTSLINVNLSSNPSLTCLDGIDDNLNYDELVSFCPFGEQDTDGDGIFDSVDGDDDNDGIPDELDANPLSYDTSILKAMHLVHANDMADDRVAVVKQVNMQGELHVDVYDRNMTEILTTISWPTLYADQEVIIFDDINGNGYPEIGLFGVIETELENGVIERKPQLRLHDSDTNARVNVYNWPANWFDMKIVKLDDLTGDGIPDLAMQGLFFDGERPQLMVKDAVSAENVAKYSYPKIQLAPLYHQLSDMDGDGIGEVGLFGRLLKNNKIQIKVTSGSDDSNKLPAYNFPDNWENISWNKLHDIDFDDVADFGLFGRSRDDGRWQLFTKSGASRVGSLGIYSWPDDLIDAQLISIPDMNFDGVPEVGVFGLRTSANRYQLIIKDGADRSSTLMNMGWPTNSAFVSLHVMHDLNLDGLPEVGMLAQRTNGSFFISIKDGAGGSFDTFELGSDWNVPPSILVLPGDGESITPTSVALGNSTNGSQLVYGF